MYLTKITLIPWFEAETGESPTALTIKPIFVFFRTKLVKKGNIKAKYKTIECPKNIGPKKGILSRKLENKIGKFFPGIPTKFFPNIADKPMPKIVNAKPVATWFVSRDCVRNPKMSEIVTPDSIEPIIAIKRLSVITIKAKPDIAPIIIIPSTPKFKTPDLSVINSWRSKY